MSTENQKLDSQQMLLIKLVEQSPEDWSMRKRVVDLLFEAEYFQQAVDLLNDSPELPSEVSEVLFIARIYARTQPAAAVEMIDGLISGGRENAQDIFEMAKLMAKVGMPLQAVRYYGAATALLPSLTDKDFEKALLDTDQQGKNWQQVVQSESFPWGAVLATQAHAEVAIPEPADIVPISTVETPIEVPAAPPVYEAPAVEETTPEIAQPEPVVVPEFSEPEVPVQPPVKTEPIAVAEPVAPETAGFFKSYDDAHHHKAAELEQVAAEPEPVLHQPEPAQQAPQLVASPEPAPVPEPVVEQAPDVVAETAPELEADELDDISAQLERDRQSTAEDDATQEKQKSGMLSSVVGMFKRGRKKTEHDTADDDIFNEDEINQEVEETQFDAPVISATAQEAAPEIAQAPAAAQEAPVVNAPPVPERESVYPPQEEFTDTAPSSQTDAVRAKKPMKPVSSTQVLANKPEDDSYQAPAELSDKTQLVSLTPADGHTHFTKLIDRYRAVPEGTVPHPVQVAAQMANLDYLSLLGEACNKNLDAFSKLLGLHKVMSDADCYEWVSDMDLLRRGFGDAVLATVVSKYSPEECREILNSVYQAPKPTAAMAAV